MQSSRPQQAPPSPSRFDDGVSRDSVHVHSIDPSSPCPNIQTLQAPTSTCSIDSI